MKTLTSILLTAALLFPLAAGAVDPPPPSGDIPRGFEGARKGLVNVGETGYGISQSAAAGSASAEAVAGKIINVFFGVLGIIFLVLMLYGGYMWMTARGESEKVDKAKDLITQAVIGIVIILAAYAITEFVILRLFQSAGISER